MDYLVDQIPFVDQLSADSREWLKQKALVMFGWADWACGTRDFRDIIMHHWTFLAGEIVFLCLAFMTFVHAWRKGGRWIYFWIGIILHGLNVELVAYLIPDVDNFWHAQSFLMFFGRRLPIYVLFGVYTVFYYCATVAAKRMYLPWWAEGPAVGLFAVLLDIPYDIMGVKLLWWSWHDTDPNIYDRMYHVPWTSYYFHAAFACSFTWLLKGTRKLLVNQEYDWKLFPRELLCIVITALGTFWLGTLQFVPIYHLFHDFAKVPTECCCLAFLGLYAIIVWCADRRPKSQARPRAYRWWFDEIALVVVLHYLFFIFLVVFVDDPSTIESIGLHEPIGKDCNAQTKVQTPSGMVLKKRTFLCPSRYDEPYYDFHCMPNRNPPKLKNNEPLEWYKICGTPYNNHMEYIFVVTIVCLLGWLVYYQALGRSGDTPVDPRKIYHRRKPKKD